MSKPQVLPPMTLAVALMFLIGCVSDEPTLRMGEERVVFTGTVEKVEPLGRSEAIAYAVGVDPGFLLVVKVNSVERNKTSPIAADESISFAIHSPSRLLGAADPTGREFRFKATWVFGPERYEGFSWLQARPL